MNPQKEPGAVYFDPLPEGTSTTKASVDVNTLPSEPTLSQDFSVLNSVDVGRSNHVISRSVQLDSGRFFGPAQQEWEPCARQDKDLMAGFRSFRTYSDIAFLRNE